MIWKAVKCSLTHADACEGTLLKFVSQALKNVLLLLHQPAVAQNLGSDTQKNGYGKEAE